MCSNCFSAIRIFVSPFASLKRVICSYLPSGLCIFPHVGMMPHVMEGVKEYCELESVEKKKNKSYIN